MPDPDSLSGSVALGAAVIEPKLVSHPDRSRQEVNLVTTSARSSAPDAAVWPRCRIRVWFGEEVICSHVAEPREADRYASLMAQRFAGLAVTIDNEPDSRAVELPHHLLWEQTVQ